MSRAYAATLGAIAMALIALRGAVRGDWVSDVVIASLIALVVFAVIGYIVGAAFDRLIRQAVEVRFREALSKLEQELAERVAKVGGSSEDPQAQPGGGNQF